jgi:DNA-binding NtrC family response regulator
MNILVVDDDKDSRFCVSEFLREMGHQVTECGSGEEALQEFSRRDFPMVLSDIRMPGMSGLDLLQRLVTQQPEGSVDIVLFTGFGDMETAIEALRMGAYDYLLKPININELAVITERIAEHQTLRRENRILTQQFHKKVEEATEETRKELSRLKQATARAMGLGDIGIFSECMKDIFVLAEKYHRDRSIPVLIQGETGTGKEVVAKVIHFGDDLESRPFVDINCAALTPSLFESELFGYEAGAFTGSLAKGQKGKLDLAIGGTLFLDEVGEIPLDLQGKLLRVIQEKEYYRVGGVKKIKTDARIICATNVDLEGKVQAGFFRKDLYYRLKVGHLLLPPLRQRKDAIIPLAELFLRDFSRQKRKSFEFIGQETMRMLKEYEWPGNVRELKNAMEWVVFMYDEKEVLPQHLEGIFHKQGISAVDKDEVPVRGFDPVNFTLPPASGETVFNLDEYVQRIIQQALLINRGNKAATARYLGITRRSLYCRLDSGKES